MTKVLAGSVPLYDIVGIPIPKPVTKEWEWGYFQILGDYITIKPIVGATSGHDKFSVILTSEAARHNVGMPKCRIFEFWGMGSGVTDARLNNDACTHFYVDRADQFNGNDGAMVAFRGDHAAVGGSVRNVDFTGAGDSQGSVTTGVQIAADTYNAANASDFLLENNTFTDVDVAAVLWEVNNPIY